jgi:hypothetical protein
MMRTVIVWWDRSRSTQTLMFDVEATVEGRYDLAQLAKRGLAFGN